MNILSKIAHCVAHITYQKSLINFQLLGITHHASRIFLALNNNFNNYSYLKDSIGSKLAALRAGNIPKMTPTAPETKKAMKTE